MSEPLINPIVDVLTAEEEEPNWLVPDLILQGSLVCLAGEPGAGKSFVTYLLGMCIAAGVRPLGGLFSIGEPKRVLYFDEENSEQDRDKYLRRAYQGLLSQGFDVDLFKLAENFWPVHMRLGGEDWLDRARECVEQVQPHLTVFDTSTPAFNILDENSNAEATQAVKGVRTLMRLTDPVGASIVLKHAKTRTEKGGRRTMRGAKAWQGMADSVMFQVKANGRPRTDGLSLTRLIPDKTRAYGLSRTVYLTPGYTDEARSGLTIDASFSATRDHKKAEEEDEGDE